MSDKWITAARLQTARKLKTLTEIIAGKKFANAYIKHLEDKLNEENSISNNSKGSS